MLPLSQPPPPPPPPKPWLALTTTKLSLLPFPLLAIKIPSLSVPASTKDHLSAEHLMLLLLHPFPPSKNPIFFLIVLLWMPLLLLGSAEKLLRFGRVIGIRKEDVIFQLSFTKRANESKSSCSMDFFPFFFFFFWLEEKQREEKVNCSRVFFFFFQTFSLSLESNNYNKKKKENKMTLSGYARVV